MLNKNYITRNRKKKDNGALWFVSFIFPLASLIIAIKNFELVTYRKYILFFALLYGFTYIPIQYSDADSYANRLEQYKNYDSYDYISDITSIYERDAKYPDIYAYTLFFITGNISSDPQIFRMLTALLYFFILIKLIGTLRALTVDLRWKYFIWFFLGCVFLMNFSAGINGVRFPMAIMVFAFGALNYLLTKKKKFLIIAALSTLIHFSMLYVVLILILQFFIRDIKNTGLMYLILLLAIVFTTFFVGFIQSGMGFLGDAYEAKLLEYTSDAYILSREDHVLRWNWYLQFDRYSTYIFSIIAVLLTKIIKGRLTFDRIANRLFTFAVLITTASIISGAMVDSISNRYFLLANFFSLSYLFYLSTINQKSKLLINLSRIYIPIFILHALIIFRGDLYTVSPYLLFGNPIIMLFYKSDVSIQTLLLG